jgi:hypothetical protein
MKMSALKKLRDGSKAKEKPAKKVASRSVKDDD